MQSAYILNKGQGEQLWEHQLSPLKNTSRASNAVLEAQSFSDCRQSCHVCPAQYFQGRVWGVNGICGSAADAPKFLLWVQSWPCRSHRRRRDPPPPQRRRQAAAPAPAGNRTGGLREKEGDCFNGVSGEGHCFNGGIALRKINWPKYICVPAGHLLGFSPSTQSVKGEEGKWSLPSLERGREALFWPSWRNEGCLGLWLG